MGARGGSRGGGHSGNRPWKSSALGGSDTASQPPRRSPLPAAPTKRRGGHGGEQPVALPRRRRLVLKGRAVRKASGDKRGQNLDEVEPRAPGRRQKDYMTLLDAEDMLEGLPDSINDPVDLWKTQRAMKSLVHHITEQHKVDRVRAQD